MNLISQKNSNIITRVSQSTSTSPLVFKGRIRITEFWKCTDDISFGPVKYHAVTKSCLSWI